MLILSRCAGKSIIIGKGDNKVTLIVLGIRGNQVRVGIDAAKDIPVYRDEVYKKLCTDIPEQTTEQDTTGTGHS
ncbi:MAG: carbon storage regulator [Gammaproteobacteria bacterium]|nr:carbon storage regulator [Gammaproteobacteria bacterium]